ncbi:hypothetical protein PBI_GAIA_58 [Mycobacterium phage Gaia]|uniref:Uncharacterized protein n=1 Tax=Mycobacterium phage Gaia TaxID=1486472 RepID=A0A068F1Q4_9CAUD|nr:hypothetical protein VC46_gp175 [Mycobacterium phage Gaia]AID58877.1 hypothetical protein PBI_GAIA_58 [Mycobacterium phage Gaia]
MTWNYRVVKEHAQNTLGDIYPFYGIREVYYEEKSGQATLASDNPNLDFWEDIDDLRKTWELIGGAFDKPVLTIKNGKLVEE